MKITSITIVQQKHHADTVYLHTDLKDAAWPYAEESLSLSFRAAKDSAEEYVKVNFPGVPYEVHKDSN